MKVTK